MLLRVLTPKKEQRDAETELGGQKIRRSRNGRSKVKQDQVWSLNHGDQRAKLKDK